jgi:hypothetical protein
MKAIGPRKKEITEKPARAKLIDNEFFMGYFYFL